MNSLEDYQHIITVLAPSMATSVAVGIGASMVGTFVLLRREGLMALAMPHVVAVGAALGLKMGWPTLPPALVAVILAVLLLAWSKQRGVSNWLLPSLYIGGLCISFLIIANSGQHLVHMQNLFTGMDVAVTPEQAWIAVPALILAGLMCALFWRRWLLLAQAPAMLEVAGRRPARWDAAFLSILAIVLLMGTSSLGAVMVAALLFLPAATVLPWTPRVPAALLASVLAAIVFLVAGMIISTEMSLPFSQSVGGVGFCALFLSHLSARILR